MLLYYAALSQMALAAPAHFAEDYRHFPLGQLFLRCDVVPCGWRHCPSWLVSLSLEVGGTDLLPKMLALLMIVLAL